MFSTIDVVVNNAGFYAKPCTDFTTDDFDAFASVNLLGFLYITQVAVKQMVKRKSGSVVTVTGTLADNPSAGVNASVSMITNSTTLLPVRSTRPCTRMIARILLGPCRPWERAAQHRIWRRALYLAEADEVTGEALHVDEDGGAHAGCW